MKARIEAMSGQLRQLYDLQLLPRYQRLQPREQRLLLGAGIAVPVVVLVFGLLLPIRDEVARLQQEQITLAAQAEEAGRFADRLQNQPHARNAIPDLLSGIEQAARSGGIRQQVTRIRPRTTLDGGKQVRVHIKEALYAKVVPFLGQLGRGGVKIVQVRIDAAEAPGRVNVELTLQQ